MEGGLGRQGPPITLEKGWREDVIRQAPQWGLAPSFKPGSGPGVPGREGSHGDA